MPDNKKITEIKWFAIYDLSTQNDFGDIYIPEDFEPPIPQRGSSFSKKSHNVSSGVIEILDSKTIKIPELHYDGTGAKTYFLGGVGAQPSAKGTKIPDELGYLDSLRKYDGDTVTLELPGDMSIFEIDWISIFDLETNENFGSVLITDGLNVPPSLTKVQVNHKPDSFQHLERDFIGCPFSATSGLVAQLPTTAQRFSRVMGSIWTTNYV